MRRVVGTFLLLAVIIPVVALGYPVGHGGQSPATGMIPMSEPALATGD